MHNRKSKQSIGIAISFVTILIVTGFLGIVTRQWKNVFVTLLVMVCLSLPFIITYIANRKHLELPSSFQSITLVFIFLTLYLGEIRDYYHVFWWWDLLLHAIFGSYMVIIALHSIKGIIRAEQATTKHRFTLFTILFGFSFTIALGTLWEIFEFAADYLVITSMVKGGLNDTATDLLIKIITAFITSIICYYRNSKES